MNFSATLRAATADDAEFMRAVYASTRAPELAVTDWSDEQKAQFCRQQSTAQEAHYRANYPTAEFAIVESGGTPIGRLYVDRWEKEIRIMDIALLPAHRGAGIGTALLRDLQEKARIAGKALSIHVGRRKAGSPWKISAKGSRTVPGRAPPSGRTSASVSGRRPSVRTTSKVCPKQGAKVARSTFSKSSIRAG